MVSRIEFFCPGCGAPEVPELIVREYYNCPNCEVATPREKLDRQRRNNYLLAGSSSSPFTVTDLGGFTDISAVDIITSPFAVDIKSRDLFIAVVGSINGGLPASLKLGASDTLSTAVEATDLVECGIYFFSGTMTTPGLQTLTVDYTAMGTPDNVCVRMLKVTGHNVAAPIDRTKSATDANVSLTFTTGNSLAQTNVRDLAIGAITINNAGQEPIGLTFKNSFVLGGRADSPSLTVAQSSRQLSSAAVLACTGSLAVESGPPGWTVCLATIKPA